MSDVEVTAEVEEVEEFVATDAANEPESPAEGSDDSDSVDRSGGEASESASATDLLVSQGDVAADYLEALLDIADLDGDIDIDVENGRASLEVVEVNEGELENLIGEDGEVLNALQDLTRLAVTRETGERTRLMLDIGGYRAEQKATLRAIAKDAVDEATSSGEPVRLAAMNSFERKVVHDVAAEAGLGSESEGSEPRRYVVITPA